VDKLALFISDNVKGILRASIVINFEFVITHVS